jgi:hypothetical protein
MDRRKFHSAPLATLLAVLAGSSASPPSDGALIPQPATMPVGNATAASLTDLVTCERSTGLPYGSGIEARRRAGVPGASPLTQPGNDPIGDGDIAPVTPSGELATGRMTRGPDHSKALHR